MTRLLIILDQKTTISTFGTVCRDLPLIFVIYLCITAENEVRTIREKVLTRPPESRQLGPTVARTSFRSHFIRVVELTARRCVSPTLR